MARKDGQGSNWIRRSTRLAIYHRDGHRCVYCARKVYAGRGTNGGGSWLAHLDHVMPAELGGSSRADNLVTACQRCNDRKQALPLRAFLATLAAEGVDTAALRSKVLTALRTPLDRAAGRAAAAKEAAKHGGKHATAPAAAKARRTAKKSAKSST